MARGGYRPGAGKPRKGSAFKDIVRAAPESVKRCARRRGGKLPLDYMLEVMNDETVDQAVRIRIAIAAAPFIHAKVEATAPGKKEQRQEAAEDAAASRLAPGEPPKLVVSQ